jgi:hypothetical protein
MLQAQLTGDPVLKLMRLKLIGNLRGPITAPSEPKDNLEAVKLLLHVLKEAGFTTGAFDASKLFDMKLGTIVKAIEGLVDKLAALVAGSCRGCACPTQQLAAIPLHGADTRHHNAGQAGSGTDASQWIDAIRIGHV